MQWKDAVQVSDTTGAPQRLQVGQKKTSNIAITPIAFIRCFEKKKPTQDKQPCYLELT